MNSITVLITDLGDTFRYTFKELTIYEIRSQIKNFTLLVCSNIEYDSANTIHILHTHILYHEIKCMVSLIRR